MRLQPAVGVRTARSSRIARVEVAVLVCTEAAEAEAKRQAARPVHHGAQLPAANQKVGSAVYAGSVLLALAEWQVVAAVGNELLVADIAVAEVSHDVAPGPIAGAHSERAGPLIIGGGRKTLPHALRKRHLQGVELGVHVVAEVRHSVG